MKKKIEFKREAKKVVVDLNKTPTRLLAKKAFKASGIVVGNAAHLREIMDAKREYYALKGVALLKAERKALLKTKGQTSKIAAAKKAMDTLLKKYNYASLAEAKMAARATGNFDSHIN
jgi:hypothetical protein